MSLPVYSFFPWVRQGLGNQIADDDVAGRAALRSTLSVALALTGAGPAGALTQQVPLVPRQVPLAGPGDIVGIESRAVVRTDPRHWIMNFEPNHVPCVEFYDEDFPWRYTPARADGATHRLRPWIALVVLEETEFGEGPNLGDRPLPFIVVDDASRFPPADQLWAWAHVHVNRGMVDNAIRTPAVAVPPGTNSAQPAVTRLQQTLDENADLAYSRLLCPRKLKDNTAYHAFVVPVFESGRLAGLGLDPAGAPHAMQSTWGGYQGRAEPTHYPYYYRWYFRTGSIGDFEYLVRLLKPRTVDRRVGTRDMDVQDPDAALPGITDPALVGVLKLGGALKVPRQALTQADWDYLQRYENWVATAAMNAQQFRAKLAALLNLADDYHVKPPADANADARLSGTGDDPLITPPLYGKWYALQHRLLADRAGGPLVNGHRWLEQLNLDPRHRASVAFGTRVVQERQEELMDAAWRQVGDVLAAQRRIQTGQLVKETAWAWHAKHLAPLLTTEPERAFVLAAPVQGRVLDGAVTVAHAVRQSALPAAALSAPARRILRPRARLARALPLAELGQPQRLLRRLNAGEVSAAPPRERPPHFVTPGHVADGLRPRLPGVLTRWLRRVRALPWVVLLILLLVALLLWLLAPAAGALAVALVGLAVPLAALLRRWSADVRAADALDDTVATPADVAGMPAVPGFTVALPGQDPAPASGATDSAEARRFKEALRTVRVQIAAGRAAAAGEAAKGPPGTPLAFSTIVMSVITGLDPDKTVPRRTLAGLTLPPRLAPSVEETFEEPFAYPRFDLPMYKPLADLSPELFLPNLNLIPQNSITQLETNQPFIEAYIVGLNHEFARELLWREYPTDQRGSYFRQFWDVTSYLNPDPSADDEAQREKLRDITPLHRWSRRSALGDHDNRERPGEHREELVLTIRGELLKKYPTAVIYAHRAEWQRKSDGTIDPSQERRLSALTPAEEDTPPRAKVRTPLYEAKVDPDLFFFGFELTEEEVIGGTGANPNDDPGWFFVIKERPGEPRFGFDIGAADPARLHVWNDLGWDNVQPGPAGSYVQIADGMRAFQVAAPTLPEDDEKEEQHADDVAIRWNKDMNAADVAYVLYQAPVLVAVHAAEMLRPGIP